MVDYLNIFVKYIMDIIIWNCSFSCYYLNIENDGALWHCSIIWPLFGDRYIPKSPKTLALYRLRTLRHIEFPLLHDRSAFLVSPVSEWGQDELVGHYFTMPQVTPSSHQHRSLKLMTVIAISTQWAARLWIKPDRGILGQSSWRLIK